MIVGVDETGDFKAKELNFFIACFIVPSLYDKTILIFKQWEKGLPITAKPGGEVKGKFLNNDQLRSFVDTVLDNQYESIKYYILATPGVGNPGLASELKATRESQLDSIAKAIEFYEQRDNGKSKIANQYLNFYGWYKNLSDQDFLKLLMLGQIIFGALKFSIVFSIEKEADSELGNLKVNIDENFIDNEDKIIFWKDVLRSQIWQTSFDSGGLILIKEWTEDHIFYKTFVEKTVGNKMYMKKNLKERFCLVKSQNSPEVRIADIIGTILQRKGKGKLTRSIYKNFHRFNINFKTTILQFTNIKSSAPNPYN